MPLSSTRDAVDHTHCLHPRSFLAGARAPERNEPGHPTLPTNASIGHCVSWRSRRLRRRRTIERSIRDATALVSVASELLCMLQMGLKRAELLPRPGLQLRIRPPLGLLLEERYRFLVRLKLLLRVLLVEIGAFKLLQPVQQSLVLGVQGSGELPVALGRKRPELLVRLFVVVDHLVSELAHIRVLCLLSRDFGRTHFILTCRTRLCYESLGIRCGPRPGRQHESERQTSPEHSPVTHSLLLAHLRGRNVSIDRAAAVASAFTDTGRRRSLGSCLASRSMMGSATASEVVLEERYLATRNARRINVERLSHRTHGDLAEQSACTVISGYGRARSLAREAAEAHFREHPARNRLLVVVVE